MSTEASGQERDRVALQVIEAGANGEERMREVIFKVIGDDIQGSNAVAEHEQTEQVFLSQGAIEPPYPPDFLCRIFEHSNALRQNVDAYTVNIDGFGYRLEPLIDFNSEDADEEIAQAIWIAAGAEGEKPTPDSVKAEKEKWRREALLEHSRLLEFFDRCAIDVSFETLRRRTRQDRETQGNGYWEILRTRAGLPARFVQVPAHTVRLLPLDPQVVEVTERVRRGTLGFSETKVKRRFRRFVQILDEVAPGVKTAGAAPIYFKQFGDPRMISKTTGKVVKPDHQWAKGDGPATELKQFDIYSPRTSYGVPRWIGALLSVLGSRAAEEVNYYYFENKSVPPLAILVSGGKLAEETIPRLESFVEENLKGKTKNFHKIMILEAESGSGAPSPGSVKIELKPLTEAMIQDELFAKYDERNIDKVGEAFRLPRLLRGQSKDFNRATAQAALRFAEEQVFQPERDEFDGWINRELFTALDVRFWTFKSNAPITRDPVQMTDMIVKLVEGGVLTPAEGRWLAGDVFNKEFREIRDQWTQQPLKMTLAGLKGSNGSPSDKAEKGEPAPSDFDLSPLADLRTGTEISKLRDQAARIESLRSLCDQRLADLDAQLVAQEFAQDTDEMADSMSEGFESE